MTSLYDEKLEEIEHDIEEATHDHIKTQSESTERLSRWWDTYETRPPKSSVLRYFHRALLEARLVELELLEQALNDDRDIEQFKLYRLAELTGSCNICGAEPMTANCNNAGCDI